LYVFALIITLAFFAGKDNRTFMKRLSSYFNEICERKYKPLGFKKTKKEYDQRGWMRLKNDIIQVFYLDCLPGRTECRIEFGLIPLSYGRPRTNSLLMGNYELSKFFIQNYRCDWLYDNSSPENLINCAEVISNAIDKYLLPLFEVAVDCESALSELIKLEELFECNRQQHLKLMGNQDMATDSWRERMLWNSKLYYMALKSRNFTFAEEYLSYQLNYWEKKGILAEVTRYSEPLEHLRSGDFAYFDDMVSSKEAKMWELIRDEYPVLLNNDEGLPGVKKQ